MCVNCIYRSKSLNQNPSQIKCNSFIVYRLLISNDLGFLRKHFFRAKLNEFNILYGKEFKN